MKALRLRHWLVLGMLCLLNSLPEFAMAQEEEDLFDFKHGMAFAEFLEQQQRYDLAIEEYLRIESIAPGRLEVRVALLRLYALTDRHDEGITTYEGWDYHPYLAPAELRRKYVGLFFQGRQFLRLGRKIDDGIGLKEPEKTRIQLQLALYEADWPRAQRLFESFEIQHVRKNRLTYGPIMHYRKPWLGAALSIVPGGGQVYAGQWMDGISSLLLVGIAGFEAYRLFDKRGPDNILAWGLAGLSGSFYIANLYGGQRAVKRYNERQDARIHQVLDDVADRDF
jgi:TM2 domain-containing membrane protein YozV